MKNIFDMVVEYTKKGKVLDRNFIIYVINTLKYEKGLEDFVKNVKYKHFSLVKDVPINYVINTRDINVFGRGIADTKDTVGSYNIPSSYERLFIINTFILKYILKTLNHAEEFKVSHSKLSDFEALYFRFRYFAFNESENLINNPHPFFDSKIRENIHKQNQIILLDRKYGSASLSERLANIKAYSDILGLITSLDKDLYDSVRIYATALTDSYLAGYTNNDEISAPTPRYLSDCDSFNNPLYHQLKDKANEVVIKGSFEERLKYGLPITRDELRSVQDFTFIRTRLPKKYQ